MYRVGERSNYPRLGSGKSVTGGVIAGCTFGTFGDTWMVIAGSRRLITAWEFLPVSGISKARSSKLVLKFFAAHADPFFASND